MFYILPRPDERDWILPLNVPVAHDGPRNGLPLEIITPEIGRTLKTGRAFRSAVCEGPGEARGPTTRGVLRADLAELLTSEKKLSVGRQIEN